MTRILLVEDSPSDADLLLNALKTPSTWHVRTVATCQEADRLLAAWSPALIISDIHLPDGNGLEWIAQVRRRGYAGPILVITGVENSAENVIAAIKAGADDYLIKDEETYAALPDLVAQALLRRHIPAASRYPLNVLYAIGDPLEAERCRARLRRKAPHIQLTPVHTLDALRQQLHAEAAFDAVVLDGDLPAANLLTIVRQFPPGQYPDLVWLAADPHPSPELARVLLRAGLAAYLPRTSEEYCTLLPIMLENATTAARLHRAQANWALSEARYSRLVENLPDVVYRYELQPQQRLTYISPAVHRLTGHTPAELLQTEEAFQRIIHPEDRATFLASLHSRQPTAIIRWQTADGRSLWVEHRHTPVHNNEGQIVAVEGIARDISETRRVRQHLQQRVQELELSIAVSHIVMESQDVDDLCRRIAAAIADTFYSEYFGILFLTEDRQHFYTHPASRGIPSAMLERPYPISRGVIGRCLRENRMIKLDDTAQDPHYFPAGQEMRSELCLPIRSGERLWGAINIEKPTPNAFSEHDVRLATLIAEHLALGLEKIALLREEQRRRAEAHIVRQVHETLLAHRDPATLHKQILQTLMDNIPAAEKGSILLLEEDGSLRIDVSLGYEQDITGVSFPPGKGYAQQCLQEQRGKIIRNAQKSPWFHRTPDSPPEVNQIQSALAVPLITQGKAVGALALDNTTRPQAFRPEDLHLLERLAPSIALSIDNTRLFAALTSRLNELAAINRLLAELQQQPTAEKLVDIFFETATALMPVVGGLHLQWQRRGWQVLQRLGQAEQLTPSSLPAPEACSPLLQVKPPTAGQEAFLLDLRTSPAQALLLICNQPLRPESRSLLQTLNELLTSALQQIHLHWRTEEQVALLSSMRDINTTLLGSLDFKTVFDLVLTHIHNHLQPAQAQIWLANDTLQELELVAYQGVGRPLRRLLHYGEGFAGQLALQRKHARQVTAPLENDSLPDVEGLAVPLRWHLGLPLIAKGKLKGILSLHYTRQPHLTFEQKDYLRTLAGQAALAIDNTETWHQSQRSNIQLFQAYESTLKAWNILLEMRQLEPPGHTERVLPIGLKLARRAGLRGDALLHFKWGVWLHDVGKLALPDKLLHKAGPLTPAERALMEEHPNYARRILQGLDFVKGAINIPYAHHERWDGSGYPRGLRGRFIPLEARIFAIVDTWDILQSPRPYSPPWSREKTLAHLRAKRGTHFDPDLIDLFLEMLERGEI